MNFKGKTAVVTGAAQGIGRTIALFLSEKGSDIVISDINEESLKEVVGEIEKLGQKAVPVKMDVSKLSQCEEMIKQAVDRFGKVDILVNNAGITRDIVLLRMKEDQWDQVIQVNLKGTFNCTKAVIRYMFKKK